MKILNPLGEDRSVMRTSILPSMLDILARNYNYRNESVRLYELGKIYFARPDGLADEPKVLALGGTLEVAVPSGYTFTVENDADWITVESAGTTLTLTVAPNANSKENRKGTVKALFGESVLAEATIEQSYRNVEPGELLIEEVYFTGSPIEGSTTPSDDQYIRLTNNSDHVIYADRVMFVTSFITGTITSVGAYYKYPELEDGLAVNNMYVIPGDGDDHPLQPGESLILALAAIDYTSAWEDDGEAVEGNLRPQWCQL